VDRLSEQRGHSADSPPTPRSWSVRLFYPLAVAFLLGIATGLLMGRFWLFAPDPLVLVIPTPAPLPPSPTPLPIRVYLSGAVQRPGVYTLSPGSRLQDALAQAGGLSATADTAAVNLAQLLQDGQHIHVPERGESSSHRGRKRRATPTATPVFPVDVNRASLAALQTIPGVGPAMAARIVAGRPYGQVEDLLRVKGIGPATLAKLQPYVTVGP